MCSKCKSVIYIIALLFIFILLPQNRLTATNHCADVNFDDVCDIEDLVLFVDFIFYEDLPPEVELIDVDFDHDNLFDISDLVYLIDFMFRKGPAPTCELSIRENPGLCLSDHISGKTDLTPKSAQSECLPFNIDSSSFKIKWYGEYISIEHFGLTAQCCLEFNMVYNITFVPGGVRVDVYERDTSASPCYCICDFNVSGLIPAQMFYEATDYFVNLYDFDNQLLVTDTIVIGGPGELETEVSGNELTIWYHNALYNCCPGFYSEYQLEGNNLTFVWYDSLDMCDCICYYDMEATIDYLPDGEYIVTLLNGGYGENTEPVGVDTVLIGNLAPHISDGSHSGCLPESKSSSEDQFVFEYADNTLIYNHLNAIYNCAFELDFSLIVEGNTLKFYEINTVTDPALCLCPFNIIQTVDNLDPGTYLIEVYSQDAFDDEPALVYHLWHTF